jgi:putative inorganic carbon (HCO3(-)) transporter
VRTIARIIGIVGLILSGVAMAQSATGHGLMYWHWRPADEGPDPFGPFVNRNHFGTWAIMAVPLLAGYLTAHASAHREAVTAASAPRRLMSAIDARVWMLLASATMLIVALAASLSRSSLLGFAAALVCGAWLAVTGPQPGHDHPYAPRTGRASALIALLGALAVLTVATQVGPAAIAHRLGTTGTAMADRLTIWHDTLPVLRDFWLTGTGVGTYPTSMAIYQRSMPGVLFNQAHNHYVQVAAEGGVLVGLPVLFALSALARAVRASLRADRSPMYWIRAGAAAGLCGVAVQSLWETGLTIPANAALAAVLAAVIVHDRDGAGERH